MIPTKALMDGAATRIATDTAFLAEATPFVQIALVKAPFTESPNLVIGDLVLADFDGYAALHADSAATQVFTDPTTGEKILQVQEPSGGWHWQTTGMTHLPETITGVALLNAAGTALLGTERRADVILSGVGDGYDLPEARFRLLYPFMT